MIMATVEHQSGVLHQLVAAGADLNLQNQVRYTVTMDTSLYHVSSLLSQEGLTALMISARSGRTELTEILLTGEDIDLDIQENVRLT